MKCITQATVNTLGAISVKKIDGTATSTITIQGKGD